MNTTDAMNVNRQSRTFTTTLRSGSLALALAVLAACSGTPKGPSAELAHLMSEVDRLQGDTRVAPYADTELRRADRAVQVLVNDGRRMKRNEYEQRFYVADKLVQIAEAEGMARYAEARGLELGRERERLVAQARAVQLERARGEAAAAQLAAADARSVAERERLVAEQARRQTRRALSEAEQARLAAADSDAIARQEGERAAQAARSEAVARASATQALSDAEQARLSAQQAEAERARALASSAEAQAELEQLRMQLAELSARKTERGLVVTLGDVLFELDRAELKPGGQRTLDKLVTAVRADDDVQLLVEGHTDSTGSREYNMNLSQRRAAAVADYLKSQGIAAGRIQSSGLGPDFPVAVNTTEAGRQQNRRVEVVLRNDLTLSQAN